MKVREKKTLLRCFEQRVELKSIIYTNLELLHYPIKPEGRTSHVKGFQIVDSLATTLSSTLMYL